MSSTSSTTVPPLISGGVMLTYSCSNACKHCAYRCSPRHQVHFMPEKMIDTTMDALARERALQGIHLAGGEATLNWERLLYAIRSARSRGVPLDYLETNASWCLDEKTTRNGLAQLREAGLDAVLISVSLFHNEFIPLARTKRAIRVALEVFGRRGVIVWTPDVLERMDQALDDDRTYSLAESSHCLRLDPAQGSLWRFHGYVRPAGRAAEELAEGLPTQPAESFENDSCKRMLEDTTHFHIDPFGNLYTGGCPGITVADVDDLHPSIHAEQHPVYSQLAEGGPVWLWRGLAPEFEPDPKGYISKCHLCLDVRKHLRRTGRHAELRPDEYYQE
jgi:hypothetical protein